MESSSQIIPYELGDHSPVAYYNTTVSDNQIVPYRFDGQLSPNMPLQRHEGLMSRPLYHSGMDTGPAADPTCEFRSIILDDCAKARFYASALEYYLLDNDYRDVELSCPLENCPKIFQNAKDMLQHLKHCKRFDTGVFWCPTCFRYESFRTRSGRRCSWDKDHLGRKFIQKSRDFLRSITGNNPGAWHNPNCGGLCTKCSGPLNTMMQGSGQTAPFGQAQHVRLAMESPMSSGQSHHELAAMNAPGELSGESSFGGSSPENSPVGPLLHRGCNHAYSVSEMSPTTVSPDGVLGNTSISPESSAYSGMPAVSRRNSGGLFNRVASRVTDLYSQGSTSNSIVNQRCASLYGDISPNHGFGSHDASKLTTFSRPPSLPPTLAQRPSSYARPNLTLETTRGISTPIASIPDFGTPPHRSETISHPVVTIGQALPIPSTPLLEENIFLIQPDSSLEPSPSMSAFPELHSEAASASISSEEELKCPDCSFKPSGKPEALKTYLKKHISNQHKECNKYPCDRCGQIFTRSDNLSVHIRKRHHIVSNTSPSKRRRDSTDSIRPSFLSQPKRRGALRGLPPETWLRRLEKSIEAATAESDDVDFHTRAVVNPAMKLFGFYRDELWNDAEAAPMAIERALAASPTVQGLQPIRPSWMRAWVNGWLNGLPRQDVSLRGQ
ncbi:hypothetical protein NUW58_g6305 [Xylaria curta]|uniref:Uncharacterized protein n=1 Tax=Xylaria curta TaxID=42375 RepID=A0ACC1NVE2_9PEZI|nr:hypothetical protein NUW58_g6305 [Xylaria curta]